MRRIELIDEDPTVLIKRNRCLIEENKDLKLENYQLREELLRLEAKLAQAFNQLMVLTEDRNG